MYGITDIAEPLQHRSKNLQTENCRLDNDMHLRKILHIIQQSYCRIDLMLLGHNLNLLEIIHSTTFWDHAPISIHLEFAEEWSREWAWRLNENLLDDVGVEAQVFQTLQAYKTSRRRCQRGLSEMFIRLRLEANEWPKRKDQGLRRRCRPISLNKFNS